MKIIFLFLIYTLTINNNSYNETYTKSLFYYIKIAYCEKADIQDWKCPACNGLVKKSNIQDLKIIDVYKNQVFSAYDSQLNKIIISFRGTNNILNWLQDSKYLQNNFPLCKNCKVHKGFYGIVKGIQLELNKDVYSLQKKHPNASIWVTGHSLGGALAYIYAIELASGIKQKVNLMTFEAPRAVNKEVTEFSLKLLGEQYRITHNKDIVPSLPPIHFNYYHFGPEIFYNENMDHFKKCNEGEDYNCHRSMTNTSITDHYDMGKWGTSSCDSKGPK